MTWFVVAVVLLSVMSWRTWPVRARVVMSVRVIMLIGRLLSSMLIEASSVLGLIGVFRVVIRVRVRMVDRVVDSMLSVLIGSIIFVTLVQLWMSLMITCIFVKAVVILLLIAVRARIMIVSRMIDSVLSVLIWPVIFVTLVQLRMSFVVAGIFIKAVVVFLLVAVGVMRVTRVEGALVIVVHRPHTVAVIMPSIVVQVLSIIVAVIAVVPVGLLCLMVRLFDNWGVMRRVVSSSGVVHHWCSCVVLLSWSLVVDHWSSCMMHGMRLVMSGDHW